MIKLIPSVTLSVSRLCYLNFEHSDLLRISYFRRVFVILNLVIGHCLVIVSCILVISLNA